jgi:hypothetical protein
MLSYMELVVDFGLLGCDAEFSPDDEGSKLLQDVGIYLQIHTANLKMAEVCYFETLKSL